jgi:small subunit ribosomal protein S4
MARYLGPVCHLCRSFGEKLMLKGDRCFSPKCPMEKRAASSRGRSQTRQPKISDYGLRLRQKQKVRYSYGIMERQFRNFFARAQKTPGATGESLLILLERRLDNVVYRLAFADSRPQARQLVRHGHILVNGHKTDIPSFLIRPGDVIAWREPSKKSEYYKAVIEKVKGRTIPGWLSLDEEQMTGSVSSLPGKDDTEPRYDAKSIIEYYSR